MINGSVMISATMQKYLPDYPPHPLAPARRYWIDKVAGQDWQDPVSIIFMWQNNDWWYSYICSWLNSWHHFFLKIGQWFALRIGQKPHFSIRYQFLLRIELLRRITLTQNKIFKEHFWITHKPALWPIGLAITPRMLCKLLNSSLSAELSRNTLMCERS